jgi:hypothetical protein
MCWARDGRPGEIRQAPENIAGDGADVLAALETLGRTLKRPS